MKNINQPTAEFVNRILGIICLEKGLSKNTITAYNRDVSLAFNWFRNKNINCFGANEKNFRDLFFFLQSKCYKPSSLSRKLSSLKQFYDVLKAEGYIEINPLGNLESFKKIKNLPKSLSEEHLTFLLAEAKNNLKNVEQNNPAKKMKFLRILTILEILYSTGMRVSELVSLPLSDFIRLKDLLQIKGKGDVYKYVAFNKESKVPESNQLESSSKYSITHSPPLMYKLLRSVISNSPLLLGLRFFTMFITDELYM